jgi:nitrogen fixation protein FixH
VSTPGNESGAKRTTLLRFVVENRWPLYLSGLLGMAIVAYAVLIYVATRPSAPRPIPSYYEASQSWDADEAVKEASRQLGWVVSYDLPRGVPHVAGTPRPVDVRVVDAEGRGVAGLTGRLFVMRPSDQRRSQSVSLVGLPHEPGSYRALAVVDQPGAWEFRLDVTQDALRFVHAARVAVEPDEAPVAGEAR